MGRISLDEAEAGAFDAVIVGGGTAGCVLANRLSASGRRRVLLLEAGGHARSPWVAIPAGFSKLLRHPAHNWRFATEPEAATGGRVIAVPRGKGLGGSTLINGMIYVRGQPGDYDAWAQAGCRGWGFADVLPYFRRIEDYDGPPDAPGPLGPGSLGPGSLGPGSLGPGSLGSLRARGGPLPLTEVAERPAIAEAFVAAGEAAGHPRNPDYNGAAQDGFGYYQVNQRGGRRVSAAAAYLRPALGRSNLAVVTGAHALRLVFDGARASGVVALAGGRERTFRARGEVILAAGAAQTPQLLELSGIGDPAVLSGLGVPARVASPGVGANYQDHYCTRMNWRVRLPVTLNEQTRGLRLGLAVGRYLATGRGILALGTGLAYGFVRTRPGLAGPDVQYFFMHASYSNAAERKLDRLPGMTVGVTQLRPESRGTIHAASPDPLTPPAIRPNFLAAEEDRRAMVEGMKTARAIVMGAPMDRFRGAELNPGPDCRADADWLAFARRDGQTIYHVCGTCRMGGDPASVVDPELRVRGVEGLRVADASVMPTIVSGNTQAAVFMIAEKAADLVGA